MATLTVENYIKTIYLICGDAQEEAASTGELARRLGVSPGTVTSMLRTLAESRLADYQAYEGVRLTDAGRRLALRILRRHRLVELFLSQTLGLTWDEVHEEAEHLEHAVSDRLIDRIDEYLKYPECDPHGDPIPKSDGSLEAKSTEPLTNLGIEARFILERVLDQTPEFLRYLSQSGLRIGSPGKVIENHPSAGALIVRSGDSQITLGREAAEKLLVSREADGGP
jgi:DtxR family Mn-dependent transcriptional regulator